MITYKHTPEPWDSDTHPMTQVTPHPDCDGGWILDVDDILRARACVNACAGMDDPVHGIRETVALAERMTRRAVKAEQQRDALAAALRGMLRWHGKFESAATLAARAALAALEGRP